jgi:FdrA protein
LADDPQTQVLVLISKPPHPEVAERVLEKASQGRKPVVVNFLGSQSPEHIQKNLVWASTLEEAAWFAVLLAKKEEIRPLPAWDRSIWVTRAQKEKEGMKPTQKYLRGLYSGGTLAYEAMFVLKSEMGDLYSNLAKKPEYRLPDPAQSIQNSIIDLGEDEYTVGRPHPMIDNSFRAKRLLQEASDPETAVILLDIVLGYGSQNDPLRDLLPSIQKGKEESRQKGGHLSIITYVSGTEEDPQNKQRICELLDQNDVLLAHSNVEAAKLAAMILSR